MFSPALAPILIYLVTAGLKGIFGAIDGKWSAVVAALVAAVLVFGESLISGLSPEMQSTLTTVIELLILIFSGLGLHDVVKQEVGKRTTP